jgi:hypothetical protein
MLLLVSLPSISFARSLKSISSFVFAPIIIVHFSWCLLNIAARRINGTKPVPPPTNNGFFKSLLTLKKLPYGPRIPITSFCIFSNNEVDPNPCLRTVTAAWSFLLEIITLIGSSSALGIQTIKNWPGFAFEDNLS